MQDCKLENKKLINRISRIEGQVKALKNRLVEDFECLQDSDPYEVIRQISAIKGALNSMTNSYIEHYVKWHLIKSIKNSKNDEEAYIYMDQLLEAIKNHNK